MDARGMSASDGPSGMAPPKVEHGVTASITGDLPHFHRAKAGFYRLTRHVFISFMWHPTEQWPENGPRALRLREVYVQEQNGVARSFLDISVSNVHCVV